jgi:hypothetical protein
MPTTNTNLAPSLWAQPAWTPAQPEEAKLEVAASVDACDRHHRPGLDQLMVDLGTPAAALRRQVADLLNRKTARPLPTLDGVEPVT